MGLFSGLEKFGFNDKSLKDIKLYEEETTKSSTVVEKEEAVKNEIQEKDLVYDKTYECPICSHKIISKVVKNNKARLIGSDMDMRPKYKELDPLKYDVISCAYCGYSSLTRYFNTLTDQQIMTIRNNFSINYKSKGEATGDIYTYEEALERHKLALLNAIIKNAKASEKAYICLKTAWLTRGMIETLDKNDPAYKEKLKKLKEDEKEGLTEAYKGFMTAIQKETTNTICGMDFITVKYLCAALAYELGDNDASLKLLSQIITYNGKKVLKDRIIALKETVVEAQKKD